MSRILASRARWTFDYRRRTDVGARSNYSHDLDLEYDHDLYFDLGSSVLSTSRARVIVIRQGSWTSDPRALPASRSVWHDVNAGLVKQLVDIVGFGAKSRAIRFHARRFRQASVVRSRRVPYQDSGQQLVAKEQG